MINGIIGKKVGMTQLFAPDGTVTPVTVIKAGPCVVVQKKSSAGPDGYDAVQLGLVEDKPIPLPRKQGSAIKCWLISSPMVTQSKLSANPRDADLPVPSSGITSIGVRS